MKISMSERNKPNKKKMAPNTNGDFEIRVGDEAFSKIGL